MVDQLTTFFNEVYDRTYDKATRYVISKCGNTSDIADILQETYAELYAVIVKRGKDYIENEEAFVMQLAKAKVYRHYSLVEKLKHHLPLRNKHGEVRPELTIPHDVEVDEKFINSATLGEIWQLLRSKPQQIQKIFYLYYYCGLKLREISAELGLNESNVKHYLYRTLQEIRDFYGKEG